MSDEPQNDPALPDNPLGEQEIPNPQPVADGQAEDWRKVAPEIGDSYAKLSSDEQVKYLMQKLKDKPPVQPPTEDAPQQAVSTDQQAHTETPYASEIPDLDTEGLKSFAIEAFGEELAERFTQIFTQNDKRFTGYANLVSGALQEQDGQIGEFRGRLQDVTLPGQLESAIGSGGSTAEDKLQASKLIDKGVTDDPAIAMRLAASYRLEAIASARGPSPSPEALAATALSHAATQPGGATGTIPTNAKGVADIYREPN